MPPRSSGAAPSVRDWLQHSSRHQPLCERTVLELSRRIQRWQQHPDGLAHAPQAIRRSALRARDRLVSHNLRLVSHTWKRHRHSLPIHDENTADALQEAALNLVRAAEKFDPARGYRFSTYGSFWVRRGFSEVEQRCKRTIRFPARKAALVLRAQRLSQQLQLAMGRQPSLEDLSAALQQEGSAISARDLQEALRQWHGTRTDALDPHTSQAAAAPDEGDEQRQLLADLLQTLTPQEAALIRQRHLQQPAPSNNQLQKVFAMNIQQLQELEHSALCKLRQAAQQHLDQSCLQPQRSI